MSMDNEPLEQEHYEIWSFPEIAEKQQIEEIQCYEEHLVNDRGTPDFEEQSSSNSNEHDALKTNLEQLINVFTKLNLEMKQVQQEFNAHLIENMALLIKKTVKKIINKELKQKPHLMKQIIETHLNQLQEIQINKIMLSKLDYEGLKNTGFTEEHHAIEIDPELQSGDFQLITPNNKYVMTIENILNTIFQVENDSNKLP